MWFVSFLDRLCRISATVWPPTPANDLAAAHSPLFQAGSLLGRLRVGSAERVQFLAQRRSYCCPLTLLRLFGANAHAATFGPQPLQVAASSTRAPIYRTFAKANNLADVTAKGGCFQCSACSGMRAWAGRVCSSCALLTS